MITQLLKAKAIIKNNINLFTLAPLIGMIHASLLLSYGSVGLLRSLKQPNNIPITLRVLLGIFLRNWASYFLTNIMISRILADTGSISPASETGVLEMVQCPEGEY